MSNTSSVRLSQCMIVKNEEKNIERALDWGKDIVCEQIVVDTGSTDKTVELAEARGARVCHFTWIDDFSAAKNFAIEQASGNWIVLADADEYFNEDDAAKLLSILERIHGNAQIDLVKTKWVHLQDDGSIMGVSNQTRIFRNHPGLRYRYRIHEELAHRDKAEMHHYDAQDELSLLHTGYGKQSAGQGEKGIRNARLLEEDLKENPQDAMRLMYLGDAYNTIGDRRQEALDCYRRVLWDPALKTPYPVVTQRAALQILSALQDEPTDQTRDEFFKIAALLREKGYAEHPDLAYYMGIWHVKAGETEQAAGYFEEALRKLEQYRGDDVVRMTARLDLPNWVVAFLALMQGDPQKAVSFAVAALRANKYCPEGAQILMKAFLTEWKPGKSPQPYWDFLCRIYTVTDLKDLLFLHKCAGACGFMALQEYIYEALPPEARDMV